MANDASKPQKIIGSTRPGPVPYENGKSAEHGHAGVVMTGDDGQDGPKAFYIHLEARPGQGEEVRQMLADILACVEREPATGPWYALRYSPTTFGIFEAFPNQAGRQAHVAGKGGNILRDVGRMNALLAYPAHVCKVDVLLAKEVFAKSASAE